jgi:DNA recombination protein RmuC
MAVAWLAWQLRASRGSAPTPTSTPPPSGPSNDVLYGIAEDTRRAIDALHLQWSTLLAGSSSKGAIGEQVVGAQLETLPPNVLLRNFPVSGKTVEFAFRLPSGRCVPIDSKVLATTGNAKAAIRAVAKYLDPPRTAPLAVMAVPDGAYDSLRDEHAYASELGVVITRYSLILPTLWSLFPILTRYESVGENAECLASLASSMGRISAELDGRLSRAQVMLANAIRELQAECARAAGHLAAASVNVVLPPAPGSDAPAVISGGRPPLLPLGRDS